MASYKALVKQIDKSTAKWLPLPSPPDETLAAWCNLHGWNPLKKEDQQMILRQTVLNTIIRQIYDTKDRFFTTPLDFLNIKVPEELTNSIYQIACSSDEFNFWGKLHDTLLPQPYRRQIGQFRTGELIANWMVSWLLQDSPRLLTDVGCGTGNFLLKSADYLSLSKLENNPQLCGIDVSPLLLNLTRAAFSTRWDKPPIFPTLVVQNFLKKPLSSEMDAVICNPPYTRHHHIAPSIKDELQAFFRAQFHVNVSRLASMAFYFLLKIIAEMPDGARAAVILPMEVLDARYGKIARQILCQHTTINAIINFSPQMSAFPNVDVGASILFFKKEITSRNKVNHITLENLPSAKVLLESLTTELPSDQKLSFGSLNIENQDDMLKLSKWFTIPDPKLQIWQNRGVVIPLKTVARVMRGIATGANDFFVIATEKVKKHSLESFVVRTIHRNREIQDIILGEAKWQSLSAQGKRVWLLYLDGNEEKLPQNLQEYISGGEDEDYHKRSLVRTRKKWYLMEQRKIPPIFFTLLTRGNPRFILNRARVRPVNMFLIIYPNHEIIKTKNVEILWALLNSEFSRSYLHSVSRTYGGNTLKVEPGELGDLPIINPFTLPDKIKDNFKREIEAFFQHRQIKTFLNQVNSLVAKIL